MALNPVKRLLGMRDVQEEEFLQRRRAQEVLQRELSAHGYRIIEVPILEPTETFVRRGGELASHMYIFQEPGGHSVSLRPEYTSAVLRVFQEEEGKRPLPVRWQYAGEVFRYQSEGNKQPRQFRQVGAELIGASGPQADAEAVALSVKGLHALGFQGLAVTLGDMGVLRAFMSLFGLSERAQLFLMRSLPSLKSGEADVKTVREQAVAVGLMNKPNVAEIQGQLDMLVAEEVSQSLTGTGGTYARWTSSRTLEDIEAGLRRKLDAVTQPQQFDQALECLHYLSQISGEPGPVLAEARKMAVRYQVDVSHLYAFQDTLEAVRWNNLGTKTVQVDLSLVPNISYYTGVVFELRVPLVSNTSLGSGGRYDGLLKSSGVGRDIPAIGFAFDMDSVVPALETLNVQLLNRNVKKSVLVVPTERDAYGPSLSVSATLRLSGEAVEQALVERTLEEHIKYARTKGMYAVVLVNESGHNERHFVETP